MDSMIQIAPMLEHHISSVYEIEKLTNPSPVSASTFIKEISNPTYLMFVAGENLGNTNEAIVGYVSAQLVSDELHIHSLAVKPTNQRNGIGSKILMKLLSYSTLNNFKSATLEVRINNYAAIELYKKFGFEIEGQRHNYYADNSEDALIMWKRDLEINS